MIKEIEKPNIEFKFNINYIFDFYKFYYDEINNEYFFEFFKSKFYFNISGHYHRIGKPAIEYTDGAKIWIENGNRHRLDGPAFFSGYNPSYWIKGNLFSEKKICRKNKPFNLSSLQ